MRLHHCTKNRFILLQGLLLSLFLIVFIGCASKAKISVVKPAEIETPGIKKIAVGSFEIAEVNFLQRIERDGMWQSNSKHLSKAQKAVISRQIRARVINLLSATTFFNLVFTDEFEALGNDDNLQRMISAEGYKSDTVDAVINGKIWLEIVKRDGSEISKEELKYVQGGGKRSMDIFVDRLVWWPYKNLRGTLGLEIKLTKLNPTEIVAVTFDTRTYSQKIGGAVGRYKKMSSKKTSAAKKTNATSASGEVKDRVIEESEMVIPNFEQIVSDLSESIAAQFIRRISINQQQVIYPIADGGDESSVLLIRAGAYQKAIDRLNQVLNSEEKEPDDIYNLGLCYEAIGEYSVASLTYEEALSADPLDLTYAKGVGRIEQVRRENRRLKQQMAKKNKL